MVVRGILHLHRHSVLWLTGMNALGQKVAAGPTLHSHRRHCPPPPPPRPPPPPISIHLSDPIWTVVCPFSVCLSVCGVLRCVSLGTHKQVTHQTWHWTTTPPPAFVGHPPTALVRALQVGGQSGRSACPSSQEEDRLFYNNLKWIMDGAAPEPSALIAANEGSPPKGHKDFNVSVDVDNGSRTVRWGKARPKRPKTPPEPAALKSVAARTPSPPCSALMCLRVMRPGVTCPAPGACLVLTHPQLIAVVSSIPGKHTPQNPPTR